MKKLIFFMIALLIGQAMAVPLFGPPQGFRNNGAVELGSLTIDGVNIDGGDISYDELVGQTYTNETAINSSIDALTASAYTNETAINSSLAALTIAAYTNETAINTTLSKMVSGSGAINASATVSTVLTASNLHTIYPMDGSGGHVTLTLPDAATNAGRVYMVVLAADMGGNNVIVDTTGAANLGGTSGPDSLTTTDAAAALTVISDGTNYLIVNKDGTWS